MESSNEPEREVLQGQTAEQDGTAQTQNNVSKTRQATEEESKFISKLNRKIKHINVAIKIIAGIFVAAFAALLVGIIVDGKTPKTVYLIGFILLGAIWSLTFFYLQRYVKKLLRRAEKFFNLPQDALIGGKKTDKEVLAPKADVKKVKDKIYYIFTGIALFGDALAVAGVALLASRAKVHAAVTVIFILAGALILSVFHTAATIRFFKRKSAAEQKTVPLTEIKNKRN